MRKMTRFYVQLLVVLVVSFSSALVAVRHYACFIASVCLFCVFVYREKKKRKKKKMIVMLCVFVCNNR